MEAAIIPTETVGYNNAGTVEFLVDNDRNQFYFMEVNSRDLSKTRVCKCKRRQKL